MSVPPGHRVVLVTGASSGIGLATARALLAHGDQVALLARDQVALDEVARGVARGSEEVFTICADVVDSAAVEAGVAATVLRFGRLDAVIHAAQVMAYGRIEDIPAASFDRVVDVGLHGTANLARAVLPMFREQGHGTLVVVNSLLGEIAAPQMGAYISAKWGQLGLAHVLQLEVRDHPGVDVCVISPGAIDTPIYDRAANYVGRTVSPPPPVIDASRVAAAIVGCLERPRRHVEVGPANRLTRLGFRLAPALYRRAVGPVVDRVVFHQPPVAITDGNLVHAAHEPHSALPGWTLLGRRRAPR